MNVAPYRRCARRVNDGYRNPHRKACTVAGADGPGGSRRLPVIHVSGASHPRTAHFSHIIVRCSACGISPVASALRPGEVANLD